MSKVRWGVLSTASIGVNKVIPATQRSELGEVVAIASRDAGRAEAVAAALDIPQALGSYEALLASPDVDAVYNPLPNHLHAEWTMKAADAGKHVLCEKPLALDAAEAQEVADHCAAAGVLLQEAFMYRFHPQWVRMRELVRTGAIGELRAVQGWFSYFNDDPDDIRNVAAYGGGALMDIGCYPINAARLLFGAEPDDVRAVIHRHPVFGTDVLTSGILRFDTAHATFTAGTQHHGDQGVIVHGTEARVVVELPFSPPPDHAARIRITRGPITETEVETFAAADQYGLQADVFARAVRDGGPVPYPPADAVANMAVVDAVVAAAG